MEGDRTDAYGIEVRHAVEGDLDAVMDQTWQVAAEGRWIGTEVPFDRELRRERFASMLGSGTGAVLVAEPRGADGSGIVGHAWFLIAPYGVADMGMLVVEEWRGRGVGRLLLGSAMQWAAGAGAHKMALEVWPHNDPAIRLYRSAGFVEEGRKVRHYRRRNGELWDSVLMGRPLDDRR